MYKMKLIAYQTMESKLDRANLKRTHATFVHSTLSYASQNIVL